MKDAATGQAIAGAAVIATRTGATALTDANGAYTLTVPAGRNTLAVTSLGYQNTSTTFTSDKNLVLDLQLFKTSVQLTQVDVVGGKPQDANISDVQSGMTTLDITTIKKVPAFLGEVDVVKSITLLPGKHQWRSGCRF